MNNNRHIKIIRPCAELAASYRAYIEELAEEERYPFVLDFDFDDFDAFLRRVAMLEQGVGVPENGEPSSTYWLTVNNEIAGVSNLRHRLNPNLEFAGGHIGIGIRPVFRGHGLGSLFMNKTLTLARGMGIRPIHVHCYARNHASAAMIRRCGGKLHSWIETTGQPVLRFLVT